MPYFQPESKDPGRLGIVGTRGVQNSALGVLNPPLEYTEPPGVLKCVAVFAGMVRSIWGGPLYLGPDCKRELRPSTVAAVLVSYASSHVLCHV